MKSLESLSETTRAAVLMRKEGKSYADIAGALGISRKSVSNRLQWYGPGRVNAPGPKAAPKTVVDDGSRIHPAAPQIIKMIKEGALNIDIWPRVKMERSAFYDVLAKLRAQGFIPEARPTRPRTGRMALDHAKQMMEEAAATQVVTRLPTPVAPPLIVGPASKCTFPLWPHNARPDQRFCDAPSVPGASWCAEHRATCFAAPSKKEAA